MYALNPTNALYFYPHRLHFEPALEAVGREEGHRRWPSLPAPSFEQDEIDRQMMREDRTDNESTADPGIESDEH